jgi:hypothetical protein
MLRNLTKVATVEMSRLFLAILVVGCTPYQGNRHRSITDAVD